MKTSCYGQTNLAAIELKGDKAGHFLQGQLSCDVTLLKDNHAQLAAYCTPKGRVIATLHVVKTSTNFLLLLDSELCEDTAKRLSRFAKLSKVSVESRLEPVYAVYGACPLGGLIQYHGIQLVFSKSTIPPDLKAESDGDHHWQNFHFTSKLPQVTQATSETFTPHDISLEKVGGVSFTKGCYVGQEVIARMQHLGKPKKQLYQAASKSDSAILPGDLIKSDEKSVGTVINAYQENEAWRLLISLQKSAVSETLILENHNESITLMVSDENSNHQQT